MQDLKGKVAVITGGASGIGFAMARKFAGEGMRVVIADVEAPALEKARAEIAATGAEVRALRTDVTKLAEVQALADLAYREFGAVNVLCNNAGVINRNRPTWEMPLEDWRWLFDVNVNGVIYGVTTFVPRMLQSGEEGHVVNTASMAGLITGGMGSAVYDASKHAVLSLTESLYRDLKVAGAAVSASVLCPGAISTNIFAAERNRGEAYGKAAQVEDSREGMRRAASQMGDPFPPEEVANHVQEAILNDHFYILPAQNVIFEWVKMGHDRMWEGRNPAVPRRSLNRVSE